MSFNNTSYSNSFLPNQRYQTDGLRSDYQKSCQPREYITSYNSINSLASSKIQQKYDKYFPNSNSNNQKTYQTNEFSGSYKKQGINLRNTTANLSSIIKKFDFDSLNKKQSTTPQRKYSDFLQNQVQSQKQKITNKNILNKTLSAFDYTPKKQIKSSQYLNLTSSEINSEEDIKNEIRKLREGKQQRRRQKQKSYSTTNLYSTTLNSPNYSKQTYEISFSDYTNKNPENFISSFRKGSGDFYRVKKDQKQYNFSKKNKVQSNIDSIQSPNSKYNFDKKYEEILKKYETDPKRLHNTKSNLQMIKIPSKNTGSSIKYINEQKSTSIKKINSKVSIDDFKLGKSLGEGKFGTVYRAIHKPTHSLFAIKKVPKMTIKNYFMIDQFILEIKIQSYLKHQNLLSLHGFFDDSEYIYLILDYMQEGTLYSHLKKKKKLQFKDTAIKVKQIAKGIIYMHDNGIAHRDIKPQNIVMSNGTCKLCDFGWSTICDQRRKTYCGTFDYAAPQILEGSQYDMSVDLWCLGVLTYELLVGKAPFYHIKMEQTKKRILNVQSLPITYPSTMPSNAIDFIDRLLKKDPEERLKIQELLSHPFLAEA